MADKRRLVLMLAAALLLGLALWVVRAGQEVEPRKLTKPLSQLDFSLGQWRAVGADQKLDADTMDLLKPQDYLLRNYLSPQGRYCAVFVAYFGVQLEGAMIHSPRHCLPGSGWQVMSRQEISVPTPLGAKRVNHLILGQGLDRLGVLYWYQGRGRVEPNEYVDRATLVWDGLFRHRTDGALVRLTAPLGADPAVVLEGQIAMASALIPAMERLLPSDSPVSRP